MSFKAEMLCQGQWSGNALRFATLAEAEAYANNLFMRWTVPTDKRAVPSDEPVNYRWHDGALVRVDDPDQNRIVPADRVKL